LICQPDDTRYLAPPGPTTWIYETQLKLMRKVARPLFRRKLAPRRARAGVAALEPAC
jgi:hypothetical protein